MDIKQRKLNILKGHKFHDERARALIAKEQVDNAIARLKELSEKPTIQSHYDTLRKRETKERADQRNATIALGLISPG